MPNILKFCSVLNSIQLNRNLAPIISLNSCCRFSTNPPSNLEQNVAIFWDLDTKPPKSISVFDAAIRLKKAATSFGFVKHMLAYGSMSNSVNYVAVEIRGQRKGRMALNTIQNTGVVKPVEPSFCRVCGRRFYDNDKLVNHFTQIHVPEQKKRLNQIESARGSRRVKLAGKFAMKMHKFRNAERDVLMPKVGGGLAGELEKAGFWVRIGGEAVSVGLRNHMVEMMGRRRVECVVLVSGNGDFVELLKEARARCVRTVSVGDRSDGVLKRTADAAFSWQEILLDKAKKEAVSVVGRWKDRDVLKSLEWTYNPEFDNSSSSH